MYEKSVSGDRIDSREFYMKMGQEILIIQDRSDQALEFRLLPNIGYEISAANKIELGVDLRLGDLFSDSFNQSYLLVVNWFYIL